MNQRTGRALGRATKAIAVETVKELVTDIPVIGPLIEGIKAYHESIEEQQRESFIKEIADRLTALEANAAWYSSEEGQSFVKKVVASALNAEYADKLNYLANALVNGPILESNAAERLKFVEMIRHLSKPALDLLAVAVKNPAGREIVDGGEFAVALEWPPELADACVRELASAGALSSVSKWYKAEQVYRPQDHGMAQVMLTDLTRRFAAFISSGGAPFIGYSC
jgi:hypothetical protein